MNKKLMVTAVAAALAAPGLACAQASNVQVYGRLNLGLDSYQATGASTPGTNGGGLASRTRIFDAGSRLGFRGAEELGGGMRAIFLIESGANIDTGGGGAGQSAQAGSNTHTGFLASRLAHVGLDGSMGTLTFGRSNVWWGNGVQEQTGTNYINSAVPFFFGFFGGGMAVNVNRQSNTVQYTSPKWNGFQGQVSWSPNSQEGVQVTSSGVAGAADAKGRLWAMTVQWEGGPFGIGYDWVNNRSNGTYLASYGLNNAVVGENIAHKFRASWTYMPGGMVSFLWVQSQVKNGGVSPLNNNAAGSAVQLAAGSNGTLKQSGWGLNWEHAFGNIQALAQYARTGNISGCSNTEIGAFALADGNATTSNCANTTSTTYVLGLRYNLSRRTGAYVSYSAVRNSSHYFMDYTAAGMTSTAPLTTAVAAPGVGSMAGADPRIFALGLMHNF